MASIRAACHQFAGGACRIEVAERGARGASGFDLTALAEGHDLIEQWDLAGVKQRLPIDGVIQVWVYNRDDDLIDSPDLTLKDGVVVLVDDRPFEYVRPACGGNSVSADLRDEAERIVQETVERALDVLRQAPGYQLRFGSRPKVVIRWATVDRVSHGRAGGISLAIARWLKPGEVRFKEYDSFKHDQEIGSFHGSWQDVVRVITAHEMAHWAQYSPDLVKSGPKLIYRKPHGAGWMGIYRLLRVRLQLVGGRGFVGKS